MLRITSRSIVSACKCRYCWAWRLGIFRSRIQRGRYDPIEEASKYLYKYNRIIVVSFTSDPYPLIEEEKQLTRKVLSILSRSRNRILVLTKNPGAFNYTKQLGFSFSKDQLKAWYEKHVKAAIKLLESLNKRYYIKKELRRYLTYSGGSNFFSS